MEKLSNGNFFCNDEAVFVCRDEELGSLSWLIETTEGLNFAFGFDPFINLPVMRSGPELSSIKAEVNFVNSSFIISTFSFLRASKLNGTIITCAGETLKFTVASGMCTNCPYLGCQNYSPSSINVHDIL